MDSIIALTGDGFTMCAADTSNARSIVVMKDDVDKIMELDKHRLLCMAGEPGTLCENRGCAAQGLGDDLGEAWFVLATAIGAVAVSW